MFNIKFPLQHIHGRKLYIADGWKEKIAEFGLTEEVDWLTLKPGELASGSHRVNAYKVTLKDGQSVYFKTYSFHGQYMDYFFRKSKCAIEVNSYQTIKNIGVPTIEPLAFGEDRLFGMLKSCTVVTLGVDDTTQLEDFAYKVWRHMEPADKKKAFEDIFNETAKYTAMIHDNNFFHYDLKWRNILVKKEGDNYKTVWIDCPRGQTLNLRSDRGRMVDLSCLARLALSYLTKTQRYRFLVKYLGAKATKENVRSLWNAVTDHLSRRPPKPVDFSE
ncbi:MAG: hypothetical protein NE334_03135 [Lentisphaeraceae bacterium]|nr:hypothetical protein [Lentisphaeraceae bacterium]